MLIFKGVHSEPLSCMEVGIGRPAPCPPAGQGPGKGCNEDDSSDEEGCVGRPGYIVIVNVVDGGGKQSFSEGAQGHADGSLVPALHLLAQPGHLVLTCIGPSNQQLLRVLTARHLSHGCVRPPPRAPSLDTEQSLIAHQAPGN